MRTKERERLLARELRREGRSVKEIASAVGVSLSSASCWVRDVPLTDAERRALRERGQARRNRSRTEHFRARRLRYQDEGRALARRADPVHVAGCMLYWAEGSKSRGSVQFVNSDPVMAQYFVEFLRRYYGLSDGAFRIACNLFADHLQRQNEIERFWLKTLHLPPSCLRKSIVNTYSKYSQKRRRNKLPYGTVRVCVHSTRVVQSIYGSIQEYAGFERSEWLG